MRRPHPLVQASIEQSAANPSSRHTDYNCGCRVPTAAEPGRRWYACSYHEGMQDGIDLLTDAGDADLHAMQRTEYRIAIRPDDADADPMHPDTLMDDIVVNNVAMFRAEQMDVGSWWVCCYLDNETHDRIAWNVEARCRPRRIDWTTIEYPEGPVIYEHEVEA